MLSLFTYLVLMAAAYVVVNARHAPPECFEHDLCNDKLDPNLFHAYENDTQFFYSCVHVDLGNLGTAVFNMGCQPCARRDTHWSNYCQACLSIDDGRRKNCTDVPDVKQNASFPGIRESCPPSNSCDNRANGTYRLGDGVGENNKFFTCISGKPTECQPCPATLIYVEVCGSCEVNDTSNPNECPVKPTGGAPLNYCDASFCDNRVDGDYEKIPNSQSYHSCTEGTCIVKECVNGTVFSKVCAGQCVETYADTIADCPVVEQSNPIVSDVCPINFCSGKSTGNHAAGIDQSFYYACSFICTVMHCPDGLVYKPEHDYCDFI